jgi:hypothetical protein
MSGGCSEDVPPVMLVLRSAYRRVDLAGELLFGI